METGSGPIPALHEDYEALRSLAEGARDASSLAALERAYPKVLLLASASYLEVQVTAAILALYDECLPELVTFVDKNGLARRYHTLFEWDSGSGASRLFGFFGQDAKKRFLARVKDDVEFAEVVAAFMEIGRVRNQLVHQNFGDFSLEKTEAEVFELHHRAVRFPALISEVVGRSVEGSPSTASIAVEANATATAEHPPEGTHT